jgi:hypothetical protein
MEIIPKPPEKIPIFEKILFVFSVLIFVLAIGFFGYFFYFTKELQSQKQDVEQRIEALKSPEIEKKERELDLLGRQISVFEEKISTHVFTSNFFSFLEEKILKSVFLTSINIDSLTGKASISGQTEDFETLIKQYKVFKEAEKIDNLKIENISFTPEGKINFSLSFSFNKEILK